MNNFEYYFEKVAQDMGMALFYAALLTILITVIVRAWKKDRELFGFLDETSETHTADGADHVTQHSGKLTPGDETPHQTGCHIWHRHAEA